VLTRKKAGLHPSPERMEQIREAYKEYTDPEIAAEERATQEDLAIKYHIPQPTLSYWFDKFDREGTMPEPQTLYPTVKNERPPTFEEWKEHRGPERGSQVASRATMKHAIKNISEKAKSRAEQAYIIGDLVTTRYFDLVNLALAKGMKLEDLISDVFNWYERKEEIEKEVSDLKITLKNLTPLTEPNWRFQQKSNVLLNFANQLVNAKIYGARINVREATRAFQTELQKIDEMEMM